jgi:hypothetical protein
LCCREEVASATEEYVKMRQPKAAKAKKEKQLRSKYKKPGYLERLTMPSAKQKGRWAAQAKREADAIAAAEAAAKAEAAAAAEAAAEAAEEAAEEPASA